MKNKTVNYTNEPLGRIKIMKDFLPKPEDLVLRKDESVKVTLALSKNTISFFKTQAKRNHSQYQKMIRTLLDQYTEHYQKKSKSA